MSNVVLIPWGHNYDRTYLVIPADKAASFLDALMYAELVKASDYSLEDDTTFEPCDMNLGGLRRICSSRIKTATSIAEEPTSTLEQSIAEEPTSTLEQRIAEEPTSTLEQRIAECNPPKELG
jgi:hypothetical protein